MEHGRIALVTGASRGLGASVAVELARRKFHVIAVARTEGALIELDDRIRATGSSATLATLDLTDHAGILRLADSIRQRWGLLDALIHAAARAAPFSPVTSIEPDDLMALMRTNVDATRALIAALDGLLRASAIGLAAFVVDDPKPSSFRGAYAASKLAMSALVRAYASETRRSGLRVVRILPPPMATAIRARGYPGEDASAACLPEEIGERLVSALLEDELPSGGLLDLRRE